jgi:fructuronate reductase
MTDEVMSTLLFLPATFGAYRDAPWSGSEIRRSGTGRRNAMDGSQKLPQRLLGTIRDRLAQGLPVARAALGVAAWMRYVTGVDELGRKIDVRDPLAPRLRQIAESAECSPARLVDGLLRVAEMFGDDLPRSNGFRVALVSHLASLFDRGAIETARRACGSC